MLALLAEALLILVVLTLGSSLLPTGKREEGLKVVEFKAAPAQQPEAAEQTDAPAKPTPQMQKPADRPPPKPTEDQPLIKSPEPQKVQPAPQLIQLSPKEVAAMDIAVRPKAPAAPAANRAAMGPVDTGSRYADTPRVSGSGPNGEPLYAASWYREPYDDELRGYLSTATGPGWGLIACRTAPDFRVEDCVKVDEYPTGSNIARSVLAAAWQFKVRPPRVGGQPKIGEWVRIRIDYDIKRQ